MTRPGLCTPVISSASWSPLRSPNGAVEEDGASWRPQRLTCCLLPALVSFIQASSLGFNSSFSGFWALETTPLASLRCTCRSQRALLRPLSPVRRTPSRFWFTKTSVCSHCFLSLRAGQPSHSLWSLFPVCFPGLPTIATDSLYNTPCRCIWYVFCFTSWKILMNFNWHSCPC